VRPAAVLLSRRDDGTEVLRGECLVYTMIPGDG
jgi:hypothetical protein